VLAAVVTDAGALAMRDVPEPSAPPGGVLVGVRYCGLCGSDVEKLAPGGAVPGSVLGHELSGEVLAGPLAAGTRIALAHHVPCGICEHCRSGQEPLCAAFAASRLDPGGFCERTAASAEHVQHALLPLPDAVSDLAGTFVEPLACVVRGCEALPDGDVLVLGAGAVGLMAAQVLRRQGQSVRIVDTDPARQRGAAELGFGPPASGERVAGTLSTVADALPTAIERLRPGGTLVVFAGGAPQTLDVDALYRRELRVVGVRSAAPRHLHAALALLQDGAVEVEPLVDAVVPLAEIDDGLRRYRRREVRKLVVAP
jgi:L-iditol 2-dehydrogenase